MNKEYLSTCGSCDYPFEIGGEIVRQLNNVESLDSIRGSGGEDYGGFSCLNIISEGNPFEFTPEILKIMRDAFVGEYLYNKGEIE